MFETRTEIVIKQQVSWEEAVSRGLEMREAKDNSQWSLGDLALTIEKAYGVDSLGKFAIEININKKSLQQYRRVSGAFPPSTRSAYLSHRHHMILASKENRFELLRKAEDENLTTSQLELMFSKNPQEVIEKKEVVICQTCKKLIVGEDKICRCLPINN